MTGIHFAAGLFACGIGLQLLFKWIGGYVADDGTLIEPFYLIPMGYLLCSSGFVLGVILYFRQ
ncbi:MAG: DUF3955 domain-containing protein [Marinovum sp.]|nr:DUF3955 domain-containing protein [Marinovum sp.]MBT7905917.1 DUF3955 domain-containing protein [Marinovum sp.]